MGTVADDGAASRRGPVALLPWGQVIEDFLEPIGLDVEGFIEEMGGGWLFGYVDALRTASVGAVLCCVSSSVTRPTRRIHSATGAPLWLLPAGRAWRTARRRVDDAYAWSARGAGGARCGIDRAHATAAHHALPWLATPLRSLARVLRAERCTAVLCQEYEDSALRSLCRARTGDAPAGVRFVPGRRGFTDSARAATRRCAIRAAAGLIIGSSAEAERVQRKYAPDPARVAIIPNPLDLSAWPAGDRPRARRELAISPHAGVVAWHGRVDIDRKGLDVLCDAWLRVSAARPGRALVLLLCGSGPDAETLRDLLRGAGPVDVRWHDAYVVDRTPIRAHLAAADVGVLPSRHEGFAVALAEMMASGRRGRRERRSRRRRSPAARPGRRRSGGHARRRDRARRGARRAARRPGLRARGRPPSTCTAETLAPERIGAQLAAALTRCASPARP